MNMTNQINLEILLVNMVLIYPKKNENLTVSKYMLKNLKTRTRIYIYILFNQSSNWKY
jgi:hypothetical protein